MGFFCVSIALSPRLSVQMQVRLRASNAAPCCLIKGRLPCACTGVLTSSGHVEHGSHSLHPTVRLLALWSVLLVQVQELYAHCFCTCLLWGQLRLQFGRREGLNLSVTALLAVNAGQFCCTIIRCKQRSFSWVAGVICLSVGNIHSRVDLRWHGIPLHTAVSAGDCSAWLPDPQRLQNSLMPCHVVRIAV